MDPTPGDKKELEEEKEGGQKKNSGRFLIGQKRAVWELLQGPLKQIISISLNHSCLTSTEGLDGIMSLCVC